MLTKIVEFSVRNKLIVILFTLTVVGFGIYAVLQIPVGAVPDITNNQVQVITTSANLSTQEIEQYITAPVEMELANLPGVEEIRSVSKFGISLVTIVFNEEMGTYLPRQLIAEKLKSATSKIPEGFGEPEMGPITTGLGEIYQYTLDVDEGYETKFTAMDLRTIQDWVVKRRLSGIHGVVEINSWGGYLKQYEVAIQPERLVASGVSLMDVFDALQANNNISGGSYIEKTNQSYFIRGDGQVKSVEDIRNIVVKKVGGVPVYVRNIATVKLGHANRYGAITANGKGETILGQVMMLKDADSKAVIHQVKERVEEIKENLPEGISIHPIVDRSELVAKTTFTVVENLVLGAIIVMLTVILLLGNIRLALVITSMIPLALLFTIAMMYIFGVDANLMSLGALDFGIIIDGAVIIVEFIVLKMTASKKSIVEGSSDERRALMDAISVDGASKMMQSAIFGQIIILIVFIPVLSLTGVEGKMFRPMALSFSFAIVGAMIMGLTWLPVASSLFLKPGVSVKSTLSDKLMHYIDRLYRPSIEWACRHKRIVLGAAMLSLVITGIVFARMGGEFVPTLDEGDFVIQPVLKTGTSLTKTIEYTTRMEKILIEKFPEVDKIVSRIGAAEVPTDPMSMEEIDMIIKLKPRSTWTSALTKEELADRFKEALMVIPGIDYEFTQPIEMRFNELITGVRSDIAIKIFGDDLHYIDQKALEIKNLISGVQGASDIILEKTAGLPQIKVSYNRMKIAHYGVDIETLNGYLAAAFGGKSSGVIFEGEKRFDMVVRLDEANRRDLSDVQSLKIPLEGGAQLPLSEFAEITYTEGPAKISRENTQRRVVVSVNVRNRDLQSVVEDIRLLIDDQVSLRPGTYIEYGGQFENLQNATNRLMIAVPVALLLIFIFLHFAFKSLKDAIMIFTAIPLATVGGVFFLWIRDMPFSVSAGVGFIALFGIAVLNGIVLIEHLKELQHEGRLTMHELIIRGTRDRLRPVLLTASAAAMGFLPMAISTGAGAEVQRPLATVVIGGLFTSTLLTLIALPLLFELFYSVKRIQIFPFKVIRFIAPVVFLFGLPLPGWGTQPVELTLEQAIGKAMRHNRLLQARELQAESQKELIRSSYEIDKTTIAYGTDENNIAENHYPLKVWSVSQEFRFPTYYKANRTVKQLEYEFAYAEYLQQQESLIGEVSSTYLALQFYSEKEAILQTIDSLYRKVVEKLQLQQQSGFIRRLDLLNARAKLQQLVQQRNDLQLQQRIVQVQLHLLMGCDSAFTIRDEIRLFPLLSRGLETLPAIRKLQKSADLQQARRVAQQHSILPDFSLNYFIGTNSYPHARNYQGFEFGVSLPLFYKSHQSQVKAAKLTALSAELQKEYQLAQVKQVLQQLIEKRNKVISELDYYNREGKLLQDELIRTSTLNWQNGEITFSDYVISIENALNIRLLYLENLKKANELTLEYNYSIN